MNRDFCYCNGLRCILKGRCVRYLEGKNLPKDEEGWWWMNSCEGHKAYIGRKKSPKYKREHFDTQQEYERYRNRKNEAFKRWLKKSELKNPKKKERRILRQRLYGRYYSKTDGRQTFPNWLLETYGISDIKTIPLADLRVLASKC